MNEEPDEQRPTHHGNVELRVIGGKGGPRRRPAAADEERSDAVVRLENSGVLELNRSVEDYQKVPPPDESARWRGKRWLTMRMLTGLMIVGVVLITIGVVAAVLGTQQQQGSGSGSGPAPVVRREPARKDDELAREMERRKNDAQELISRVVAAESPEDLAEVVRGGEVVRELMAERWEPLRLEQADIPRLALSQHATDDMIWMTARGLDRDGGLVDLVLVMEDGRLRYDWAASWGIGEVPFADLRSLAQGRRVTMRVVATRSNFHTSAFPEDEFECYRLHLDPNQEPVWGYVRRGSEVKAELDQLMNRNSTLLARVSQVFLTVALENTGQGNLAQFEIVELVRPGWVEE